MAKILVVDDSVYARSRIIALLDEVGHEAVEASDGAEAVAVFQRAKPDVVLLDITMPVMDGISALGRIMALDPEAKVVMVTAAGQERIVMESINIGARDFVLKPFDAERVTGVLAALLNSEPAIENAVD